MQQTQNLSAPGSNPGRATNQDRHRAAVLRTLLNFFGYPKTLRVSNEIYDSCERVILDWIDEMDKLHPDEPHSLIIGPNEGLMFKGVELLRGPACANQA